MLRFARTSRRFFTTRWFRVLMAVLWLGTQMLAVAARPAQAFGNADAAPVVENHALPQGVAPAASEKPLHAPAAAVSLDMPSSVFLGEDFQFTVTFDNTGDAAGYGPFVDLIFPVTGQDGDDGIDFLSASYLGTALQFVPKTFPDDGSGSGCVEHPWLRDSTGAHVQVCGKAGDKLVSIKLPFGSFVPDQPPLDITIKAHLSDLADISPALSIKARGGYMYGATPEDDWCCGDTPFANPNDTNSNNWPGKNVTPKVFTFNKTYIGPSNLEDETATGPNYPRKYVITMDIADGQTLTDIDIHDLLPDNIQYIGIDTANTTSGYSITSEPATNTPGGELILHYNSVTGTSSAEDIKVTVDFYVPRQDKNGDAVIDPSDGTKVTSDNIAWGTGNWDPKDTRDPEQTVSSDATCPNCPPLHTLEDKSLAIQKSVAVVGGGDPAPGKTLEYTLSIQISDFFAFNNMVVTDVISDGQHVDSSFTPTLQVNGNNFSLSTTNFSSGNYDIACDYSGTAGAECTTDNTATPNSGETTLTFDLSDELTTQGLDSRLVGGCVDPVNGSPTPDCDTYNDGPTTATITFRTVIQEAFTDDYPSNDASVDQGDKLKDTATVAADLLDTGTFATGSQVTDDAAASITIGRGTLTKAIYAINGSTTLPTDNNGNVVIKPGDKVTYRLTYTLTTSDEEELSFDDYLPLPVFDVADPDADGSSGPTWTFSNAGGIPNPGVVTLGPSDTFYNYMTTGINNGDGDLSASQHNTTLSVDPVIASDSAANKIMIYYANYDDTRDQPTTVDLLFTVVVSAEPFADGLFLTNQAHAYEGSTNAASSTADAIVQVKLTEPVLTSGKGVVWTSNGNASFDPPDKGPAGVTWLAPGNAPRWSGTISASGLDTTPINANVSGVDAGDIVTFAITIRNTGSSLKGAFDIRLQDVLDTNYYQIPTTGNGLNLQIYYGDGSESIDYTGLGGGPDGTDGTADDLFGNGIELKDPVGEGVCQAHDPNSNNDVIIITYDLQVKPDVHPGQAVNTEHLMHYAGAEGGPNHLSEDQTDESTAQVVAGFEKTLEGTEIDTADNASDEAVIGELVTYKLTATIPEGQIPNAQISDHLDDGLAFVNCVSVTPSSSDVTTDLASGSDFSGVCANNVSVTNNGQDITFDLGTITNTNSDNGTAETLTITYQAVVLNTTGNQAGTVLNNEAAFSMDDGSGRQNLTDARSAPNVTIIEPSLTLNKTPSTTSADAGDTITYTLVVSNGNTGDDTTAYDVVLTDAVASGLSYVPNSFQTVAGSCDVAPASTSDTNGNLEAKWDDLAPGKSCTLTYQATVDYSVAPGQSVTNTADLTWTSLPGDETSARSTYNTDSVERTGADGVGGTLNDYADEASATVTVNNTVPQKYLKATSEAFTGDPGTGTQRVAIGEIVRYRLVVQLPEGTSDNFQIRDLLPSGLTFLNDGTAKAAFVSNGAGITSSAVGSSVPAITDSDCFLTGNSADGTTPAIPATCSALADGNVSTTSDVDQDDNSFATGTDVYFRLGDLKNNDSDSDAEYVIVEFNVLVDNHSGSATNDTGDNRVNNFRVYINGTQNGNHSNMVTVRVAEPSLTLDKSVSPATADAGDSITYTLKIQAASGDDLATAFDLSLTDAFDAYLTNLAVSVSTTQGSTCTGNGDGTTTFSHSESFTGNTLNFSAACLDPGKSITLTVTGTLASTTPAGYTLDNTANLTWTSLPGDYGMTSNATGSQVTGAPGSETGERTGSGSGNNDYTDNGTATLDVRPLPTIQKSVSPTDYTIGDEITFNLLVTLPEGVTKDLQVYDNLPAGLEYVSHQVITTAAASGGLLSANFNGTFTNDPPNVTAPGGSGGDLTLDFGDTTVPATSGTANNAFLVQITARVLNESGNQDGANLDNTGAVRWTNPNTNNTDSASDTASISIIEPRIATTKSVSPASNVEAGTQLTYTVRFTNTGHSTAYDVTAEDVLAQGVSYDTGSAACTDGSNTVPVSVSLSGNTLTFDGNPAGSWDIPVNGYIQCTYTATAQNSLYVDGGHTNTADADWSSQDGVPTSPDVERVYDDTTTYNFDGTQDTATATFTVAAPTIAKDDGGVTQTLIGDTIHFTLTIASPKGTLRNAVVTDHLPAGLTYVSNSQQDNNALSTTPTFTVTNNANGTTTLEWDYGATPVVQSSPLVIEYDAVVANVSSNQDLTTLTNDAYLDYTDASGTGKQLDDSESSQVTEASLSINKSVSVISSQIDAGGQVKYTITIENPNDGSSHATAYDVHFADDLPSQVTLDTTSVSVSGGTVTANNTSGNKVDVTISDIALGDSVTITYSATLNTTVTPQQLINNTGNLDWTSQPGSNANERTGADGAGGLNDYVASDTANFTTDDATALDKLTPSPSQYTIGQEVAFDLLVTLNEGTTPNLVVSDDLPNGLEYVTYSIVTSGAPLTKTFSDPSAVNSPTATVTSGDGGGVSLDFGDVTVSGNNDTDDNSFIVRVVARVVNDNAYKSGDTLTNQATLQYTNGQGATKTLTDSANITLVEPQITTTKSVSPTDNVEAGDTLTYTLKFENTGNSTAYDVTADDTLPGGVTYDSGSASCQDGNSNSVAVSVTASGQTLHFDGNPSGSWDIPAGGSITCTYTATADSNITLGGSFTNTADADWSSLNGSASGERVYDDTAGTPQDGTQDEDSATFTTDQPSTLTKDDGGVTQSMIGDTIHVTITINSPTGQLANTVVTDVLPAGMKYVTGSQSVSGISAATFTVTGPNDGTAATTLKWDFGSATVSSSPFTISYDAVATNTSGNVDGTKLVNNVTFSYDDAGGTTHTLTGSDDTTIVEAALTVDKQISSIDVTRDAGDTVTYQVTIANPNDGSSHATAYDVHFTDDLPAAVTLDTSSVQVQVNGGATGATNNSSGNTVDVTIDNVPVGADVVVTYSATLKSSVTPAQLIANTADVTWTSQPGTNPDERTGADGAGGLNDYAASDTTSFNVHDPYYSKSLESTSEASTVDPKVTIGEVLTFVLNITLPEGTTPSLHIVDNLPDGLQYIVGSAQVDTTGFNGTVPSPTITPTGSASSGQDVVIDFGQITVTPDNDNNNNTFKVRLQAVLLDESGNQNGDTLTNTATLSIGGGSSTTTNGVDVTVVEPDLSMTKAADDTTPNYGQTVTYTLTVAHTADSTADAFDVVVTDTIPAGLTYVANSATAPTGWTVAYDDTTKTLTWTGDLSQATGSVSMTYQATVDGPPAPPNIGDTLTNSAALTWTSLPGTDANERTGAGGVDDYAASANANVTVTAPNLTLSKDDGGASSAAGQVVVYHLAYTNSGNVEATGVTITETVPANTTFDAAGSTAGWSCSDGAAAGTTCTFSVGTVAANTNGTVDFAVQVDDPLPAGVAQISNTASIADDGSHGPEDTSDNTASDTTPVAAAPDLRITKTDGVEVVAAGSQLTYTLTVTNQGTQHATNVVIADTIPDHTTFVSASDGGTYDDTTRTVTWPTLDHVNVGETITRTVTVTVGDPLAAGATTITNQATVQDDGTNGDDIDPADNTATDVDAVTEGAKTYQSSNQAFTTDPDAAIGEILTYQVTLNVPAGRTLNGVTLTDTLGRGLAFLACESVDLGGVTSTAGDAAALCNDPVNPTVSRFPAASTDDADDGRQIVWNFGTLTNAGAADATVTVRYRVVVLDSTDNQRGVSLNNQAVWHWEGGEVSGSAAPVTLQEPDLALAKTASPRVVLPDEPITFTLEVSHTDESDTNAYDVVVTDELPDKLHYVDASLMAVDGPTPTSMDYDPATHTITVVWDSFPLGTTAHVQFQATLHTGRGYGVTNRASLVWTSLPGDVRQPQSTYNSLSHERFYDPNNGVDVYGVQAEIDVMMALPETGFAPGRVTALPPQQVAYDKLDGIVLEIPKLGVKVPVVGVPRTDKGWDLSWLWNNAGWLEGTAFPTRVGNTAITAHNYLPDGEPGPFVHLYDLRWGDQIIIHAYGQRYIYEVSDVRLVGPNDASILKHKERDWVTLITCKDYDEAKGGYDYRVAVQAVLVKVEPEP